MYEIKDYVDSDGHVPIRNWHAQTRDVRARVAVDRRILRLQSGNFGDHKFLRDGVWELRIDVGPGYRVYYAMAGSKIVLLLCAGDKRKQDSDIERACGYWRDWQRREKE